MKKNKSSGLSWQAGQISRALLVLAVVILVAAIIVYFVMKMAEKPSNPTPENPDTTIVQPIYQQTIGNIKFIFESAINHGNVLYASNAIDKDEDTNLTTTENFIEVKNGAQNIGKINLDERTWDIENIVDSEGREYVPLDDYSVSSWLPETDLCGELIKPSFEPTPCVKIYEVSKKSTGLKIRVMTGKDNDQISSNNLDKNESALVDLIVTQ